MKKGAVYAICGALLLAGAVVCGVKVFQSSYAPKTVATEAVAQHATDTPAPTPKPTDTPAPVVTPEPEITPEPTPTPEPYVSPIDFEALQAINPDIYAWLEIDNTNISYPVVQDPYDDTFYLDHNSDRNYSANGAIFSEAAYNGTDMSDPVTVLYGHHMRSGDMFGNLQQYYSSDSFFQENQTITVYTPDAELTYGVFAAVPYIRDHILHYHDFSDAYVFEGFFDEILSTRDLSAHINEAYAPEPGDQVLILSTCLIGNNTNRFLVMGKLLPSDR